MDACVHPEDDASSSWYIAPRVRPFQLCGLSFYAAWKLRLMGETCHFPVDLFEHKHYYPPSNVRKKTTPLSLTVNPVHLVWLEELLVGLGTRGALLRALVR